MREVIFRTIYGKPGSWLCDVALILTICFLLFFWGLGAIPFYDKQEAREALVVWEINDTGNWILPLRNGVEMPEKPILFHWLGALVSKFPNRVDELTVRFPSALLGSLGVLLTYLAGASLWGRSAGVVSALVLATSFQWWQAATTARVDMTLSFVMFCSFLFFYYLYRSGGGRGKAFIFGLLLGLATLAKGPLGFVVPCFTVLIFLWTRRDFSFLKKLHLLTIISACILVAGSWYALALWQGGNAFFLIFIKENFHLGEEAAHPHPFYYYIPALFLNMAPWSLFLLPVGAFIYHYRHRLAEEGLLYVVVWFVTVFIFFSAFTQKRTVYILPLYPAIALLFGAWWQKLKDKAFSSSLFLARLAGCLNAAAFIFISGILLSEVMGLGLLKYVPFLGPKDQEEFLVIWNLLAQHQLAVLFWAALCGLGGIFIVLTVRRGAWGTTMGCITGIMVVSFFVLQNFDPDLARHYSFKAFTERVLPVVNDAPLFFYCSGDYGVVFYAGRRIPIYGESLGRGKIPFYLLVWEEDWKQIPDKEGLSLEDASDSIDRQGRGRLFLVAVKTPEAVGNIFQLNPCQVRSPPRPYLRPARQIDQRYDERHSVG